MPAIDRPLSDCRYLRTGKMGRGILGRWGPNQAVDTIVTRRVPPKDGKKGKADREKALAGGGDQADAPRLTRGKDLTSSGLQVALNFRWGFVCSNRGIWHSKMMFSENREDDQLWAIPGPFMK